jgi:vitamin B12 transporter
MYAFSDTVELYARIENLFDEQYQQIIGYGTPGVSGHIGARFAF